MFRLRLFTTPASIGLNKVILCIKLLQWRGMQHSAESSDTLALLIANRSSDSLWEGFILGHTKLKHGKQIRHRGREQACARPPAQIPACALTHGAPASDDDERPLVRPRALKPVAVTRETPTQGRHRKCVLHYLDRQCRVVVSTDRLGVDPQRPLSAWVSRPAGPAALGM